MCLERSSGDHHFTNNTIDLMHLEAQPSVRLDSRVFNTLASK